MPEGQSSRRAKRISPAPVLGVLGAVVALLFAHQLVFGLFGGDPSGLIRVSEPNSVLVAERLGRAPIATAGDGHDGYFFFQLAADPLLRDPNVVATFDDPPHRAARLVYPLLAGVGGTLPGEAIAWTLVGLNVIAFGFGTYATSRLARQLGASPILGLFFTFNIGLMFALSIDGSSVLASALLFAGFTAMTAGRIRAALILLALAVLTREFFAVFAVGALAYEHRHDLRRLANQVGILLTPYFVARGFLTWWFRDVSEIESAATRNFGMPFRGILDSLPAWRTASTLEFVALSVVMISAIGLVVLAWKRPSALSIAGVLAVPALVLFTDDVLAEAYDASRVLAPLATLFPIALVGAFSRRHTAESGSESGFGHLP